MTMTTTEPAVWVGCLACYNSGRLVGDWVPATDAADLTPDAVHGRSTPHEELWCFDVEGLPVSREMSPSEAAAWGAAIAEVDEWQRAALLAWVAPGDYIAEGTGDLPSLSDFEERYAGEWDTFEDYAAELFDECGYGPEMPEHLAAYFDMAAWARDLAYDYTTTDAPGGGVFIFRSLVTMRTIIEVTDATGSLLEVFTGSVGDHAAEIRALVEANPGAVVRPTVALDAPCSTHPMFERDYCPCCGTAREI